MAGKSENCNKTWNTEEIIKNADHWSLAGDAALLNSIKAYAENLLTKTASLSNSIDEMLDNLNEAGLRLDISQNEFQSLRNTQFIESRVYEDDETLEDNKQFAKKEEIQPSEEQKEKMLKNGILEGLGIMDKYFDRVEVSISDSEEEGEDKSHKNYMLKAKDFYADRLLPLVIGTEEWYKKWHAGLIESSSESESEKTEVYSDSETEDDLPKDLLKGSETSSELDFSSQTSENRPVASSTFNDSTKKPDIFASSDESDTQGSLPIKTPISNKIFAEQLAAKLGNVINEQEDISTQVNKRPIQPAQTNRYVGDLFSDEPPPLDDLEDSDLPKSVQSGLFSGGQGLFDDNEDELFWGQQNQPSESKLEGEVVIDKNKFKEDGPLSTQKGINSLPTTHISKGLFDSDDSSSDDNIFVTKKQPSILPYLQSNKVIPPLFDEEPPELEKPKKIIEEDLIKKKPIGGVAIFGAENIFGDKEIDKILKNQKKDNIEEKTKKYDLFDDIDSIPQMSEDERNCTFNDKLAINNNPKKNDLFEDDIDTLRKTNTILKNQTKNTSIFDDDDDLFKNDLFSNINLKKPNLNLFDDIESDPEEFINNVNNNETKLDLFTDIDNAKDNTEVRNVRVFQDYEERSKFVKNIGSIDKKTKTVDLENNNSINIDAEKESEHVIKFDAKDKSESVQEKIVDMNETTDSIMEREVIGAESKAEREISESLSKNVKDLFDDDEDNFLKSNKDVCIKNKVDLFDDLLDKNSVVAPSKVIEQSEQNIPQLQVTKPSPESLDISKNSQQLQDKNPVDLFSSTPPPDDDEWDTKSDNFFDNDDGLPSYHIEDDTGRSSIFDREPPSLEPNDSSGIVRDHNTRVDSTDDSSFYPYASSSRRFSTDLFNEQQSQDSFFITKNKTESVGISSNLDIISEDTKTSNLILTPSGILEDFENSKTEDSSTSSSVFLDINKTQLSSLDNLKKAITLFDDDFDALDHDIFASEDKVQIFSKNQSTVFDNVAETNKKETLRDSLNSERADTSRETSSPDGQINSINNDLASITKKLQNEHDNESPKTPTIHSPKKLKHNMNINVNALLPGYSSPKIKELLKSSSLDLPKEQEGSMNFSTSNVSNSGPHLPPNTSEKAVSFEDALDNLDVLHSVTKDRAKIPIKRRPSTRRGRQEAIRKSVVDFSLENADASQESQSEPIGDAIIDKAPIEHKESLDVNMAPKEIGKDIFSTSDDEELFPKFSKKSKIGSKNRVENLFDSGDSDSDLFGGVKTKSKNIVKQSLIYDSSSDEELFTGSAVRKGSLDKAHLKNDHKPLKKLENMEASDNDPLTSLL